MGITVGRFNRAIEGLGKKAGMSQIYSESGDCINTSRLLMLRLEREYQIPSEVMWGMGHASLRTPGDDEASNIMCDPTYIQFYPKGLPVEFPRVLVGTIPELIDYYTALEKQGMNSKFSEMGLSVPEFVRKVYVDNGKYGF